MSVPALRFPGFEGEWSNVNGDEITTKITKGSSPNWQGYEYTSEGTLFVTSENVRDGFLDISVPKFLPFEFHERQRNSQLKYGDILINIVGASIGRCCLFLEETEASTNQAVALFRVSEQNDRNFIAYCYQQNRIQKRIRGTQSDSARPNLSLTDLGQLGFVIPTLPEQKKIAAFLGAVDAKIAALRARREGLERYKRGLMQALFSRRLRFTKPDGSAFPDWEEKRLGEVATRSTTKNSKLEHMRVLTNSAIQGVIDQGDYFDKDIANAENLAGYYVLRKGDFVYNPRISVSAPVGPIKRNDLGDGVMSPLYTVFRFKTNDTSFFNAFFETTVWHRYMKAVANYGARHDRMAITSSDFMNMPIPLPYPDEQRLIADALSAMDVKIEAVADQITRTEDYKKGLLQQMFV